jgi:hypothetical protein
MRFAPDPEQAITTEALPAPRKCISILKRTSFRLTEQQAHCYIAEKELQAMVKSNVINRVRHGHPG